MLVCLRLFDVRPVLPVLFPEFVNLPVPTILLQAIAAGPVPLGTRVVNPRLLRIALQNDPRAPISSHLQKAAVKTYPVSLQAATSHPCHYLLWKASNWIAKADII